VKRFPHWPRLLKFAALLWLCAGAHAQIIESEVKGFKHAFVDEQSGKRTMLLSGGSATNISNAELLLRGGVQLQFFNSEGKTNLEVSSLQCIYNTRTKLVSSGEKLEAASPDAQISLEGTGFEYQTATGSLVISNEVHAILRKDLIEPRPGARGGVTAQTNAAPAPAGLVHIFSDRMRYQTNLAVFEDNVRVDDPPGKLTCGSLTVAFSESAKPDERRRVENILASRDVVIDSEEIHATGDRATYRLTNDVVELSGNPTWRLREYAGRAEELVVNRKTREFHAMRGTEMTLPSGAIGRNGFLLPESGSATNTVAAAGRPVLARSEDFQFRPDTTDTNFNIALFSGDVQVKSEKGNLDCELMTIRSTAQSNRTESVVAERNVLMEQGNSRVTGAKAVYKAADERVEVTGKPTWKLNQREGSAEVLAFDLKSRTYQATRDVRMRLPPGGLGASTWLARGVAAKTNTPADVTSTNQPAPVEVAAGYFELKPDAVNTNLSEAIYRGHVRVSEAERMNLSCDSLTLTGKMTGGTNQVERVAAEGGVDLLVRESDGERRAQGDKAVYTANNGEVVLTAENGVKFVVTDAKGVIEGSGSKAVYASAKEALELTGNNPMLSSDAGKVWGDTVILDRANTTLRATGNWKMKLNAEVLRRKARPAPKKTAS